MVTRALLCHSCGKLSQATDASYLPRLIPRNRFRMPRWNCCLRCDIQFCPDCRAELSRPGGMLGRLLDARSCPQCAGFMSEDRVPGTS